MKNTSPAERFRLQRSDARASAFDLGHEVERGLCAAHKSIPCRFFYDAAGSRIFEEICTLPEYYLTRAEDEILARYADEIVAFLPNDLSLVELGSGSARKTRRLIGACLARRGALRYVPIDISQAALEESARALLDLDPRLSIDAFAGEYHDGLRWLDRGSCGPRLVLWLGSNVGNFDREHAARFLVQLRASLHDQDRLLIGIDLRKSKSVLESAYDDARGVTARFNLNLLARINAELGGDFDRARFRHVATYDEREGKIEMSLESLCAHIVRIEAIGRTIAFAAGERIHTEDSYKYSREEIDALALAAGMTRERTWLDSRGLFSVHLFKSGRRS